MKVLNIFLDVLLKVAVMPTSTMQLGQETVSSSQKTVHLHAENSRKRTSVPFMKMVHLCILLHHLLTRQMCWNENIMKDISDLYFLH